MYSNSKALAQRLITSITQQFFPTAQLSKRQSSASLCFKSTNEEIRGLKTETRGLCLLPSSSLVRADINTLKNSPRTSSGTPAQVGVSPNALHNWLSAFGSGVKLLRLASVLCRHIQCKHNFTILKKKKNVLVSSRINP